MGTIVESFQQIQKKLSNRLVADEIKEAVKQLVGRRAEKEAVTQARRTRRDQTS